MPCIPNKLRYILGLAGAALLFFSLPLLRGGEEVEYTNLNVLVKSAETDKPVFQARLTLQFRMPGKVRSKLTTYSAKTNNPGPLHLHEHPEGEHPSVCDCGQPPELRQRTRTGTGQPAHRGEVEETSADPVTVLSCVGKSHLGYLAWPIPLRLQSARVPIYCK